MVAAFVFVRVAAATSWADASAMHSALHAIPGVKTVYFLMGPTDVVLLAEAADMKTLIETVGKVRAVKGVAETDSRMVLPI
jgi:hypothetical protein